MLFTGLPLSELVHTGRCNWYWNNHDIVYLEYDVKIKWVQQAPRKLFLYKRADMGGLHDRMGQFKDFFLSTDHSSMTVNDMWVTFKSKFIAAVERFIPPKMTKTKYSLPWIDNSIKRLIRKRERLYLRARKSSCPDLMNNYKKIRAHVQKVIRDAYWRHVSNIFTLEEIETDPDTPKKNIKVKRFWSFVKSLKKEASGITSLRENGILKTDTVEKANIGNRQFQSAFTREADSEIPLKGASPFSSMEEITLDPVGVAKLLTKLNIHKASGPDGLSARILQECSSEIAPVLAYTFNESLAQGAVPDDCWLGNVTPVFKKGENTMLLITDRYRSRASVAKPWSVY